MSSIVPALKVKQVGVELNGGIIEVQCPYRTQKILVCGNGVKQLFACSRLTSFRQTPGRNSDKTCSYQMRANGSGERDMSGHELKTCRIARRTLIVVD